jgi:hypothetical protein
MKNWSYLLVITCLIIIIGAFADHKVTLSHFFQTLTISNVFIAVAKIIIISLVLYIAMAISVPAVFIDLLLLLFLSKDFLLIRAIWNFTWKDITINWFWESLPGEAIVIAAFLLSIVTHFVNQRT